MFKKTIPRVILFIVSISILVVSISIQLVKSDQETLSIINLQSIEPEIYSDDFSIDTGMWEYLGSAYRDSANQYLVLTETASHKGGVAFFKIPFTSNFVANFSYKAGGGDGFVMFFYKQKYSSFGEGGNLAFGKGPWPNPPIIFPGYGIEFDNWHNSIHNDPLGNHIALIKDHVDNHLAYVNDPRTGDNCWHNVSVVVKDSSVTVYVDQACLLYTSPSPRDLSTSRMPSSA